MNPGKSQQTVLTNALIAEKLTPTPSAQTSTDKPVAKKASARIGSARSGVSSSHVGTSSRTTAHKGGVIKTVVLPHEDFNKLAVEGQMLAAFLKQ